MVRRPWPSPLPAFRSESSRESAQGISAGIGGTASAGIPLTPRTLARSVVFATGHDASGAAPDNLAALGRGADVLVLYMAGRQIGPIAASLIAAGRTADEAIAFITDATTIRQTVRVATRGTAGAVAAGLPANGATLIVIGPVLSVRDLIAPAQQTAPMTARTDRTQDVGATR